MELSDADYPEGVPGYTPVGYPAAEQHYLQLMGASQEASVRGLTQTAKWTADLACGLQLKAPPDASTVLSAPLRSIPAAEQGRYMLAKTFFDTREFQRCSQALSECGSNVCVFLRFYALYLAGERTKDEETEGDVIVRSCGPRVLNPHLEEIKDQLKQRHARGQLDGYGHYVLGVVLREEGHKAEAQQALVRAVTMEPLFWGAWRELGACCIDSREIAQMTQYLPQHWMANHLMAWLAVELHDNDQALVWHKGLLQTFPASREVLAQMGVIQYNSKDMRESAAYFELLEKHDPFRIETMDVYSNVLFLENSIAKLTFLAHRMSDIDKYRPETCCTIGNHYSFRGSHEKAVLYFQRALKLNRRLGESYLAAWTLVGHEYLQLKNTPGAIAAYRRAIEINPRDYRAWYGLGQTYEICGLGTYAAHYFRQAQRLRPNDPRMWQALSDVYAGMMMTKEALNCLEMVDRLGDGDPTVAFKAGELQRRLDMHVEAALSFERYLALRQSEPFDQDMLQACGMMWRGFMSGGQHEKARLVASQIMQRVERENPGWRVAVQNAFGGTVGADTASEALGRQPPLPPPPPVPAGRQLQAPAPPPPPDEDDMELV